MDKKKVKKNKKKKKKNKNNDKYSISPIQRRGDIIRDLIECTTNFKSTLKFCLALYTISVVLTNKTLSYNLSIANF